MWRCVRGVFVYACTLVAIKWNSIDVWFRCHLINLFLLSIIVFYSLLMKLEAILELPAWHMYNCTCTNYRTSSRENLDLHWCWICVSTDDGTFWIRQSGIILWKVFEKKLPNFAFFHLYGMFLQGRCGARKAASWRCSWLTTVSSRRTCRAERRIATFCWRFCARTSRAWRECS